MARGGLLALVLGGTAAFLSCSSDTGNNGGGAGSAGLCGFSGAGNCGGSIAGSGGAGGACSGGLGALVTSTVDGEGFDAWEQQPVEGCFFPTQSYPYSCPSTVVVNGRFSLTSSVCSGSHWGAIVVGSGAQAVDCYGPPPLTPASCSCHDPVNPGSQAPGGSSGQDCDAGAP